MSAGAAAFVLQNISGGFGLNSMSTLLFFVAALVVGCAGPPMKPRMVTTEDRP